MANTYVNKVQLADGTSLIDISDTTATASDVANSKYIYMADGSKVQGSITSRFSSDLTASGATVTVPSGYYSAEASKAVASGTEGTPTATKGTVSSHSISVTPSVTNSAGYISGGTHTGTAVSVSASELVSGNLAITSNGSNIDVTNYETVSVAVSGGGGAIQVETIDFSISSASSITISGLKGEPTSYVVDMATDIAFGTPSKIAMIVYDGTTIHAQTVTNTNNAQATYVNSGITHSYSNGTLTITSTGAQFVTGADRYLVYTYEGSSSDIHTTDVQVGSGATSITFTGLDGEPLYWSCIFKGNFGQSSGYQRVMGVYADAGVTYGYSMDTQGDYKEGSWSTSYSSGSLTITSNSASQGGYFHQPGYYQLTYAISPYETVSKTYRATTSSQNTIITPSTGYDAIGRVNISIPAISQTNLTAGNIKSGTTVTISNGFTSLWSVTGTYSGGGSANIATATMTNSSNQNTSIEFTLPSGRTPKAFFARLTSQIARNSNSRYYYVFDMRWDGSSTGGVAGNTFYMYNGTLTNVTSGYSYSQSNTTFTLSSTGSRAASPGSFYNGTYELVYIY